jgi:CheY-like chemotaxis protein
MTIPVLIVDDSALSRKLVIKALPQEWDVEITQAINGKEALTAYRAGKGHVMFLDLTMPEMDGFQVLETLKAEGANAFVIVISADIQPQAQERARQLGAVAFIKKPLQGNEIRMILTQYGML